jgi:hypothetical protein
MRSSIPYLAAAGAVFACLSFAQQPRPQGATIDERLAAVEAGLATLDTRLGLATARSQDNAGQTGVALDGRITALERELDRLAVDIQRVERLADSAVRAASDAQRAATSAEQAARDAAMRIR